MEVEFSPIIALFRSFESSVPTDADPVGGAACGLPSPAFNVFLTPLFAAAAVIAASVGEATYPVPPGLLMALFLDTETETSGHERLRHTRWIVRTLASKSLHSLHSEVFSFSFFVVEPQLLCCAEPGVGGWVSWETTQPSCQAKAKEVSR